MATEPIRAFLDPVRDAVANAGERTTLEAFLDSYRDALVRKLSGLSDEDGRRSLVGSETTLTGLVKHLRVIEMNWFQRVLGECSEDDLPADVSWRDYAHSSFILETSDTLARLIAAYRQQCEVSRGVAGRYQLTDAVSHPELGSVSLRWIYIHMIDETARHVGHADILREQIDGTIGV